MLHGAYPHVFCRYPNKTNPDYRSKKGGPLSGRYYKPSSLVSPVIGTTSSGWLRALDPGRPSVLSRGPTAARRVELVGENTTSCVLHGRYGRTTSQGQAYSNSKQLSVAVWLLLSSLTRTSTLNSSPGLENPAGSSSSVTSGGRLTVRSCSSPSRTTW